MAHPHIEAQPNREESLTPEQQQAWGQIHTSFEAAGMAAPPKGFMQRWEVRFAAQRAEDEKRLAWRLLGVNAAIAGVLLVLVTVNALPALSSPLNLFTDWVESTADTIAFLRAITTTFAALGRTLPGAVPASLWLSALAGLAALVGVWALTLKQYALNQGVVR